MFGRQLPEQWRPELSQHFLRKGALAASLVQHTSISTQDLVLEIGPGRGALTRELAARCRHLIAVEVDADLIGALSVEFGARRNVHLIHGDFLQIALPTSAFKVFANLPFSRTTDIIHRLVDASVPPDDVYLIIQREAAERFAGYPYGAESLQSLHLKPWWHVEILRRLRRTDFDPPPLVDSVLLWLARRPRPLVDHLEGTLYRSFVATAFGRTGGTMKQCIRQFLTDRQITRLASDLRFNPAASPSSLSFDQWLGIFRYVVIGHFAGITHLKAP